MADPKTVQSDIFDMPKGSIFKKLAYVLAFVGPASMICSTSMGPGTATSCIPGWRRLRLQSTVGRAAERPDVRFRSLHRRKDYRDLRHGRIPVH